MATYIINKNKPLIIDGRTKNNGVIFELSGAKQLGDTLAKLMDKQDVKWAVRMMKKEAKPIVQAMRSNINKSKKRIADKTGHKPGQLRKSIGTLESKRYKKFPLIYVGARSGRKQRNDGWYGLFTEFGTKRGIDPQTWHLRAIQTRGERVMESMMDELQKYLGNKSQNG